LRREKFQPFAVIGTSNCAVIIPCLNESASITALVAAVGRQL
jgi:hypothetical protein